MAERKPLGVIEGQYLSLYGPSPRDGKWTLVIMLPGSTIATARLDSRRLRGIIRNCEPFVEDGASEAS